MAAKGEKKTRTATQKKISGFHSAAFEAGLLPKLGKKRSKARTAHKFK